MNSKEIQQLALDPWRLDDFIRRNVNNFTQGQKEHLIEIIQGVAEYNFMEQFQNRAGSPPPEEQPWQKKPWIDAEQGSGE